LITIGEDLKQPVNNMLIKVRNFWKEGKGDGKASFLFRLVSYHTAILIMLVHHIERDLSIVITGMGHHPCFSSHASLVFISCGKKSKQFIAGHSRQ
jgi:hypothetical protein